MEYRTKKKKKLGHVIQLRLLCDLLTALLSSHTHPIFLRKEKSCSYLSYCQVILKFKVLNMILTQWQNLNSHFLTLQTFTQSRVDCLQVFSLEFQTNALTTEADRNGSNRVLLVLVLTQCSSVLFIYYRITTLLSRYFSLCQYIKIVGEDKTGLAGCAEKSMHSTKRFKHLHKNAMPSESFMASEGREEYYQYRCHS